MSQVTITAGKSAEVVTAAPFVSAGAPLGNRNAEGHHDVFGRPWENIRRAQRKEGSLNEKVAPLDEAKHKAQIESDVKKFKIAVHKDVKEAYKMELPASYKLNGDMWEHVEASEPRTTMKKCDKCGGEIEDGYNHVQEADGKCKSVSDGTQHQPTGETSVDHPHASEAGKEAETVKAEAYVRCREVGVPFVKAKKVWVPGQPVSFIWMPASTHQITASYGRGDTNVPIELNIKCDEAGAQRVAKSFEQIRAANPRRPPFICIEHQAKERVGEPLKFEWGKIEHDGGADEGIVCTCDPSELGARSINGKNYVSFSPTFDTDADYSALRCSECAKGRDECGCKSRNVFTFGAGARGSKENPAVVTRLDAQSVGSVTNWPAFRSILPVAAREPDGSVKAGAPIGNKNAAGEHIVRLGGYNAAAAASDSARAAGARAVTSPSAAYNTAAADAHTRAAESHESAADNSTDPHSKEFHNALAKMHRTHASNFDRKNESGTRASDAGSTQPAAVHASGTSEGARKGWEEREGGVSTFTHKHDDGGYSTAVVGKTKKGFRVSVTHPNGTQATFNHRDEDEVKRFAEAAAKNKIWTHDESAKASEPELSEVNESSVFASLSRLASDPSFAAAREASERADAATVKANGTSEGAKKGWEHRTGHAGFAAIKHLGAVNEVHTERLSDEQVTDLLKRTHGGNQEAIKNAIESAASLGGSKVHNYAADRLGSFESVGVTGYKPPKVHRHLKDVIDKYGEMGEADSDWNRATDTGTATATSVFASVFASLSRLASDPSFAAARESSERADAATVKAGAPMGNKNASGPHKLTVQRQMTGGALTSKAVFHFKSKEEAQKHRDDFYKDNYATTIEPDDSGVKQGVRTASDFSVEESDAAVRRTHEKFNASEPEVEHLHHSALLAHASAHESITQAVVSANERGDEQAARLLSQEARRHQQAVLDHKPLAGKLTVFASQAARKASVMTLFRDRPVVQANKPPSVQSVFDSQKKARESVAGLHPLPPSREEKIAVLFAPLNGAVTASGTSEGARKGWEIRTKSFSSPRMDIHSVVDLSNENTVFKTTKRHEAEEKLRSLHESQAQKDTASPSRGLSLEEAKEHLHKRSLEGAFGKSWDEIEQMQGGKLKRDLK